MKTSRYEIRLAEERYVSYVGARLREEDKQEIRALMGDDVSVLEHVRGAWQVSRDTSFAWLADEEPVCLFGVRAPTLLGVAAPWLLATEAVSEHWRALARYGKSVVKALAAEFPHMQNYVDARNERTIQWLVRVGFVVYYPRPVGIRGELFHPFDMRA